MAVIPFSSDLGWAETQLKYFDKITTNHGVILHETKHPVWVQNCNESSCVATSACGLCDKNLSCKTNLKTHIQSRHLHMQTD